jgi:opacity protein-like surface antigen
MYWKVLLLAALIVGASVPSCCQVVAPVEVPGLPLNVGVAYSNFDSDLDGRISGITAWADWHFYRAPSYLRRLGIELEGRDLNFGRTGNMPNLRFDTIAAGPIYTFRFHHKFLPYGKFLFGYGSVDFKSSIPTYSHDSRTIYAPAGGLDYRLTRSIWLRGDYEYQFWPNLLQANHYLSPNGFSIGASYDFHH